MAERVIETDICIVGAGMVGSIMAAKLAQAGRAILVLERGRRVDALSARAKLIENRQAGDKPSNFNAALLDDETRYDIQPVDDHRYFYSRVLAVGGSSLHWRALCPRPVKTDLKSASHVGVGIDWPIDYDSLEPYLGRAEIELGVAGTDDNPYSSGRSTPFPMEGHPMSYAERELVSPACQRLGWTLHNLPAAVNSRDHDGRPRCKACRICDVCPTGARYSADLVHVPLIERSRGRLLERTTVRRVTFAPDGRCTGVVAVDRLTKAPLRVQANTVIIAAGGVESARLLLLSQLNGGPQLSPRIGKNFGDNIMITSSFFLEGPTGSALGFPTAACDHFRTTKQRKDHNSYHLMVAPGLYDPRVLLRWSTRKGQLATATCQHEAQRCLAVIANLETTGTGTLSLSKRSKDENGDPILKIGLGLAPRDQETAQAATKSMAKLAKELKARYVHDGWATRDYVWGAHPRGSLAMAAQESEGVVDPTLRVFGTENVYVASSAVFPHFGSANPSVTAVALALRLVEHLLKTPPLSADGAKP